MKGNQIKRKEEKIERRRRIRDERGEEKGLKVVARKR